MVGIHKPVLRGSIAKYRGQVLTNGHAKPDLGSIDYFNANWLTYNDEQSRGIPYIKKRQCILFT